MATVFQLIDFTPQDLKNILREVIKDEFLSIGLSNYSKGPPQADSLPQFMSLKEAAAYLQITTVTLAKTIKSGEITICIVGKRKKIKLSEIQSYVLRKK